MRDYISLGPTPSDEDCEPAGTFNYDPYKARKEQRALINQLRRMFGPEPEGARLSSKLFNNGEYREVVCYFEDNKSMQYALMCEGEFPERWDDEAREELGL